MTGFIKETPEVLADYKRLLDRIPMQEPANGGPTDEQFASDLNVFANSILERGAEWRDPFPDPLLTSAQYRTKR